MATVLELAVNSGKWDAGLKKAQKAMNDFVDKQGGFQQAFQKNGEQMRKFLQIMGNTNSTATTARGKMREYKKSIEILSEAYRELGEAERKSANGQEIMRLLEQRKRKFEETRLEVERMNKELSGTTSSESTGIGQLGNLLDSLGSRLGISGNLTEMLTSKTALMTGAMTAAGVAVAKTAEAWANYNTELSKQQQITTVTTGLEGGSADQMTDAMRGISDTYNVDFREAINAANTLMTQFGVSGSQAIQLIRDGMQGMILGDGQKLLQMIQQYAPSFRDAGISASQLVAIIHNSEGGIFTDQNMNAIVMGIKNIRLMTNATSEALAKMGIDGEQMTKKLNDGTMSIFDALKEVSHALEGTEAGSQAAGEVMQQVFGRQGVAAGTNLAKAIDTLNLNLEETKNQTGDLGQSYAELEKANEELSAAMRECFGYNGWSDMAAGIKSELVGALTFTIEWINEAKRKFIELANLFSTPLKATVDNPQNEPENPNRYVEVTDGKGNVVSATKYVNGKATDMTDYAKTQQGVTITYSRPKTGGKKGGKSGGGGRGHVVGNPNEIKAEAGSIAALNKEIAELNKQLQATASQSKRLDIMDKIAAKKSQINNITMSDRYAQLDRTMMSSGSSSLMGNMTGFAYGMMHSYGMPTGKNITTPDTPFNINNINNAGLSDKVAKTLGSIATDGAILNTDDGKEQLKDNILKAVGGLKSVTSGLQEMGVVIPDSVQKIFSVIQGATTVIQGAQAIISVFSTSTATAQIASQTANTAALLANTSASIALTAALGVNSVVSAIPFAHGGVVRAAQGYVVPGNYTSGDRVPALLNSGEIVLNRAQTGIVADSLSQNSMLKNLRLSTYLDGRRLKIVINNDSQSRGQGKLVTSNTL